MSENNDKRLMHSDAWWWRALEGELTTEESRRWSDHRAQCDACRREWAAIQQVDQMMLAAPEVLELPAAFTEQIVQRAEQKIRLRRLLSSMAATLVVGLVTWFVVGYLGWATVTFERLVHAILIGWQPLLGSLIRTLVGLLLTWKMMLPTIALGIACGMLLLMPNGMMATAALVWLARRRSQSAPV